MASPTIEAEVTFLSEVQGGRSSPITGKAPYRPHIVVGSPDQREAVTRDNVIEETYLGVEFHPVELSIAPGESTTVTMFLLFQPIAVAEFAALQAGTTFTIREGAHIVGYGTVLRRNDVDAV